MSTPKPAGGRPARKSAARKSGPRFPWLLLLIFLATLYVFWILPLQLGPRPVEVQFEGTKK